MNTDDRRQLRNRMILIALSLSGALLGVGAVIISSQSSGGTATAGHLPVSMEFLSNFAYGDATAEQNKSWLFSHTRVKADPVPDGVKALSGRSVSVQGFMVPFKVSKQGKLNEFLLVKDQMGCCYSRVPRMNEWIWVRLPPNEQANYVKDVPITVTGTLEVGEEVTNGMVQSLYRMKCDKVAGPLDL